MSSAAHSPEFVERRLPPVTELGMATIALVAVGVIYLAAYLPRHAPLGPAIGLLVLAAGALVTNGVLLLRERAFAWWRFRQVAGWTLLAYVVIAGMIQYAFVYDHTHGPTLAVMTLLLAVFTLNAPVITGFTVARFEERMTPAELE